MPASAQQHLKYYEKNLTLTLNQLVGRDWSVGARYRLSDANLAVRQGDLPALVSSRYQSDLAATLHQVDLFARFNHSSGFFGQLDALWTQQSNRGYTTDIPGDDFWQLNAQAGYRFFRRQAELRVGMLNLADQNYRLNPLNLTTELPRQRTAAVSLKFSF